MDGGFANQFTMTGFFQHGKYMESRCVTYLIYDSSGSAQLHLCEMFCRVTDIPTYADQYFPRTESTIQLCTSIPVNVHHQVVQLEYGWGFKASTLKQVADAICLCSLSMVIKMTTVPMDGVAYKLYESKASAQSIMDEPGNQTMHIPICSNTEE